MRNPELTWPHRLILLVVAVLLAMILWALVTSEAATAGGRPCEPVLVIDRQAGSLTVYPARSGEMERLTLSLCYDGSVTGKIERYRNERQELKR